MASIISNIGRLEDFIATGSLTAASQSVILETGGASLVSIQLLGTFSAAISFEVSLDGINWAAVPATQATNNSTILRTSLPGIYLVSSSGFLFCRVFCVAHMSGSVAVTVMASPESSRFLVVSQKKDPTFIVTVNDVVIGNDKSMLSIVNASDSPRIIKVHRIYLINSRNAALTGVSSTFELRKITSHSSGTDLTPVSLDSQDTLPSEISVKTAGIVGGETVLFSAVRWSSDEWGPGTLDQEGLDHAFQQVSPAWTFNDGEMKALTLRSGEGVHIKHTTNSTAGQFTITIYFTVQ